MDCNEEDVVDPITLEGESSDDELVEATDEEWGFHDWYGNQGSQDLSRGQAERVLGTEMIDDTVLNRPPLSMVAAALASRNDPMHRNLADPSRNKVERTAHTAISSSSPVSHASGEQLQQQRRW